MADKIYAVYLRESRAEELTDSTAEVLARHRSTHLEHTVKQKTAPAFAGAVWIKLLVTPAYLLHRIEH